VAAPFVDVSLGAQASMTIDRLATAEFGPLFHIWPDDADVRTFVSSDSASGIGDVLVRGKWRFFTSDFGGMAVAADVRLPTGDEGDLLGTGLTRYKVFLIGSDAWGQSRNFGPHFNVGYSFSSGSSDVVEELPDEISYTLGFDLALSSRVTLAVDGIGRTLLDSTTVSVRPQQYDFCLAADCPNNVHMATRNDIFFGTDDVNLWNGSVGFRINPGGTFLISVNALFPLGNEGLLDEDVIPTFGVDYSF
jgi:hypothetical protein